MPLPMILILVLLTLVSTFGGGFVVNMITKRWWVSTIVWLVFILYILYRTEFGLKILDWVLVVLGLLGVILSGLGFRTLQRQGYQMFQQK